MTDPYIICGDPHVTVEELPDARELLRLITELVSAARYAGVIFLGDLHHNHASVRVEVMEFWRRAFLDLKSRQLEVWALVGNHDMPADANSTAHALQAYADLINVVDEPKWLRPGVIMMPYYHSAEEALGTLVEYGGAETAICHQEFNGARYENGFYAPGGVDPKEIPQGQVISGHVHGEQEFGKVWYPGSPRWRISTDANIYKALYAVWFDENGNLTDRNAFGTETHCRKLVHVVAEEGKDILMHDILGPANIRIDLHGSQAWVDAQREIWGRNPHVTTRGFPTRKDQPEVRESQGVSAALATHVRRWQSKNGTPPEVLQKLVAERVRI